MYCSEQSFTGLGTEDCCSLFYWSWAGGQVLIVLLVLGRRTGAHCFTGLGPEDRCLLFYWSWAGGPVLIVRTE